MVHLILTPCTVKYLRGMGDENSNRLSGTTQPTFLLFDPSFFGPIKKRFSAVKIEIGKCCRMKIIVIINPGENYLFLLSIPFLVTFSNSYHIDLY